MAYLFNTFINIIIIYLALINVQTEKIPLWKRLICLLIIAIPIWLLVPTFGQITTVLVIGLCLFYLFCITKNKYLAISSAVLGYIFTITINYFITSVLILVFDIDIPMLYGQYNTIFNILFCIMILIITHVLKRLISRFSIDISEISKPDCIFTLFILIGCLILFITNFIIAEHVNYRAFIVVTNTISYFFFITLTVFVFSILIKKTKTNDKIKNDKIRYEDIIKYTNDIESVYNSLRNFKHDYMNILATLSGYIEKTDSDDLKNYFNNEISVYSQTIINHEVQITELSNIVNLEFKSLLMAKLYLAQSKDIIVNIDIKVPIDLTKLSINKMDFFRITGIFLDNAIEACEFIDDKRIDFGMLIEGKRYVVFIGNTCSSNSLILKDIKKLSYSTKGNDRGVGLYTVEKLLSNYNNVILSTSVKEGYFTQKLEIN